MGLHPSSDGGWIRPVSTSAGQDVVVTWESHIDAQWDHMTRTRLAAPTRQGRVCAAAGSRGRAEREHHGAHKRAGRERERESEAADPSSPSRRPHAFSEFHKTQTKGVNACGVPFFSAKLCRDIMPKRRTFAVNHRSNFADIRERTASRRA